MPGDDLAKVTPGEPLLPRMTASTFNAVMDATGFFRAMQQSGGARTRPWPRQAGVVYIKNDSGEDRDQFDILGIDGPLSTPTECEEEFRLCRCLAGIVPEFPTHFGRFAVLMDAIPDGAIGRAVIDGITPCKLFVVDAAHVFGDITNESASELQTRPASGGAQILWQEDGTGSNKWAIVRLAPVAIGVRWGKVQEGHVNFFETHEPVTTASVKLLDDAGAEVGGAFSVGLDYAEGMAPNLAAGDVVPFDQQYPPGGESPLSPRCLNCRPDLGYGRILPVRLAALPRGWAWCDGENGTDDLTDQFLMCVNEGGTPGATGGYATHGGGTNDHDAHWHDFSEAVLTAGSKVLTTPWETGHTHSETSNIPPHMQVRMMMRVS